MSPEEINLIAELVVQKLRETPPLPGPDYTPGQLRERLGLHENTMNKLFSSAEYYPIRGSRKRLFKREEVERLRRQGKPIFEFREKDLLS
jgi:hypothetical protein